MKGLDKLTTALAGLVQLGSIIGLTAIGLKRNNDAYKAECKLIDVEFELIEKEVEICMLKRDIAELKKKYGINDEDLD